MKAKLLLSLLLIGALFQANAQELSSIIKPRLVDIENLSGPDSISSRHPLLKPNDTNRNILAAQNLPYPIIFIHGLNSNSTVWFDMRTALITKGLSYGGNINFCLNFDNNNSTANKNIYPEPGADIALFTNPLTELIIGDFYFLNFDVNNVGDILVSDDGIPFNDVLSNEASIVKQGIALKYAVQMVLQKTGRDKVILMGHSMGGLASREYLQNPINWQSDGSHHIAKLITTGTPHGGYTGTNAALVTGINSSSEAYRDLRKEFTYSGSDGTYLYGGIENQTNIDNSAFSDFYNVDVNCNGINGDNSMIVGLNDKTWINDLDYSYIVGICTNCDALQGLLYPGDGIVRSENANLSNFTNQLPIPKNEFIYEAAQTGVKGLHSELPQAIPVNFRGLDEPNEYNLAYEVNFSNTYKGFITVQPSVVGAYPYDFDDYKFLVNSDSQVSVFINNTFSNPIYARIINSNYLQVGQELTVNSGSNTLNLNLSVGLYYLEIFTTATNTSYLYPYTFTLSSTLSNPDFTSSDSLKIYPNPTTSAVFFDNTKLGFTEVQVFNYLGQEVAREQLAGASANQEINISNLSAGVYVLKFHNGTSTATAKVVKQ